MEENFKYTNKVDIWALSCIFYEVVFGRKAFANDFSVLQYLSGDNLHIPTHSDTVCDAEALQMISQLIQRMLDLAPLKRPNAVYIRKQLKFKPRTQIGETSALNGEIWQQFIVIFKDCLPFTKQLCSRFMSFLIVTAAVVETYSNYPLVVTDLRNHDRWPLLVQRIGKRLDVPWLRVAAVIAGTSLRITFITICYTVGATRPVQIYEERVNEIRQANWRRLGTAYVLICGMLGYLDHRSLGSLMLIAVLTGVVLLAVFVP